MLLKILLFILIVYWAGKFVGNLFKPVQRNDAVKGDHPKNKPLDLSKFDVEDADFEEIDE